MPGSCLALEMASGPSMCLQHWCFKAQLHQLQMTQALLTHPYLQVLVCLAELEGRGGNVCLLRTLGRPYCHAQDTGCQKSRVL